MPWSLTRDPEVFAASALSRLAERPVENTLVLTILEWVRAGNSHSGEPAVLGWYDGEPPAGAVIMTPPFDLILAEVPKTAVRELVVSLRRAGVDVPGVSGEPTAVTAFADVWTDGTALEQRVLRRQRLYRLRSLLAVPRPPAGSARVARVEDVQLLVRWLKAFFVEAGLDEFDAESAVASRVADERIWLWSDAAGVSVSFAGRQKTTGGVARVGPVYTPPEHRRRGHGAAVTAACTADALARDASEVVLYTDLANPTSNSIYQQIGFEPLSDSLVIRFAR